MSDDPTAGIEPKLPALAEAVAGFARMALADKALLAAAWPVLGLSALIVRLFAFRRLAPLLGRQLGAVGCVPVVNAGQEARARMVRRAVRRAARGFEVETARGPVRAESVVVATGGKSIPKMGATGFGYKVAEAFGLPLVETRPALVPLTFAEQELAWMAPLTGVSLPVQARTHAAGKPVGPGFAEDGPVQSRSSG